MLQQDQACSSGCAENTCCRFFVCARCRCQALVCSRCDRGLVYCGRHCALEARLCNQRKARAKYQATSRGRKMHAQRSRQYRVRHPRVTDQGSIPPGMPNLPAAPQTGIAALGADSRRDPTLALNFLLLLRKTCLRLRSSLPNPSASPAFNRKALRPAKSSAMTPRRQIYANLCRR
jgi:hypothetical protein